MKALDELGISPTPWKVIKGQSSDDMWCEIDNSDSESICDCMVGSGYEQIKANARIIKAAPKMYDALYKVYKYLELDKGVHTGGLVNEIIKALAEAGGEEAQND